MSKRGWRNTLIGACGLAALTGPVAAAEMLEKPDGYGNRPITIIVPYGAGGGSDQLSRAWADAVEKVSGLTFQIVNKPGGGGTAAIPDFMLARPDGYTILQAIDDAVSAFASGDIRESPAEDWHPICMTQITFNQIYVRTDDERFSDWESFAAYAREHPGQVSVANLGKVQSMERVTMAQLEEATGLQFKQIPFDKPAERYGALIGGHVDALFEQPGDVRNFIQAEQMKPILTFLDERPELFADTPTHKEAGADFDALTRFRGFYVKNGVPEERIAFLEEACHAAFETEGYSKFNKGMYMDVIDSFRDHAGSVDLIDSSAAAYKEMYEKLGL